jgi:hypothetical protein
LPSVVSLLRLRSPSAVDVGIVFGFHGRLD